MAAYIYVQTLSQDELLEDFAGSLFSVLEIDRFERRENSNYFRGYYFRSRAVGIEITVSYADLKGLEGYQFCIFLTIQGDTGHATAYLQDHAYTLASLLLRSGWRCFVPDNSCGSDGEVYEPAAA